MLVALAADFAAAGATVDVLRDVRAEPIELPGVAVHGVDSAEAERRALAALASQCNWTVIIAPEFDGHLLVRAELVERSGGRLLGPPPSVVALTADKQATAEHLARRGVAVPRGIALAAGARLPRDFSYPAVLKPRDGAGSLGVELLAGCPDPPRVVTAASRLEAFCPGLAASVTCLCGPRRIVPLLPCRQNLGAGGDFSYQGGSLPLASALAFRARDLASRAVATLPDPSGYLGVDLILGDEPAGKDDMVVEINPRLTTSYVGLRALSRTNLARAMVRVACGQEVELCWNAGEVRFTFAGELDRRPEHP